MFSLASFHKQYETTSTELVIKGRTFEVLLPKDLTGFINPRNVFSEFPLWAKIWPASWVLADCLSRLPAAPGQKIVEIGAGVGFVSIVAAAFGHDIVLTEYNPDALAFARANAAINGCPQLSIQKLDWFCPELKDTFDYIVASEVTYKKEDWTALINLFKNNLTSRGTVVLTGEMRRSPPSLYSKMNSEFNVRAEKKVLRSADDKYGVFILQMTPKDRSIENPG